MKNSARLALSSLLVMSGCATHKPAATITAKAPAAHPATITAKAPAARPATITAKAPTAHPATITAKAPAARSPTITAKAPAVHSATITAKAPALHSATVVAKAPAVHSAQPKPNPTMIAKAPAVHSAQRKPNPTIIAKAPAVHPAQPKPDPTIAANTHFAAGQSAESKGDVTRAIAQYQAALAADPRFQPALLRLGIAYTNTKQFDAAIEIWHRYIAATNDSAAGYCDLALTFDLHGRTRQAELAYKSAVERDPKNEPARVNYGLMLARLGRFDAATIQLQAVLTPADVHYDIAVVLELQGKTDAAQAQYRQALELAPKMNDAKTRLADLDTGDAY